MLEVLEASGSKRTTCASMNALLYSTRDTREFALMRPWSLTYLSD